MSAASKYLDESGGCPHKNDENIEGVRGGVKERSLYMFEGR